MNFRDRLLLAAAHAGVPGKQADIARFLNLNRQTINRWFRGATPDTRLLTMAAGRFGVDPTWLSTGIGSMIPGASSTGLSTEERDLVRFYRNAQPGRKKAIYDMAKALGKVVVVIALTIPALTIPSPLNAAVYIKEFLNTHCRRILLALRPKHSRLVS